MLMEQHHAWDTESYIFELFHKLKFFDFEQEVNSLSGGQQKRLSLGLLLLSDPDVYILDEPTNHLDIEMIEWLENFLTVGNRTFLMVTHDRYFLDRVCNEIIELYQEKIFTYRGNYSDYLEKKTALQDNQSIQQDKTNKLLKKELEWVRRMPQARTTKSKSRTDAYYSLKAETAKKIYDDTVQMEIDITRLGTKILEFHNVHKELGGKKLIANFSYKFARNDRVGIIGPNGVGKSTLLKLISATFTPDQGKVVVGDTVRIGLYKQDGLVLKQDRRVIDVIRDIAEYLPLKGGRKVTAETLLERFLFPRSQQQVYFSQLSGGERRRLYLLTILMDNPNFLILDEPTNDLDIVTINVLEEFLLQFKGCLIIVSHDRFMLDKMVDHLFIFEGAGKIKDFPGSYTSYLQSTTQKKHNATADKKGNKSSGNDYEKRKELKRVEKAIEKLTKEKKNIHDRFATEDLSIDDSTQLGRRLKEIDDDIEINEEKWMDLVENISA
ncbi:UNVERIFIED_CONTAM: hypothetical protein GTU68_036279 [Idotea baltica]|nr:hypothetical protein [Idotea baltica]